MSDSPSEHDTWDPPHAGTEREMLDGFLRLQRHAVVWKLDGLDDDTARTVQTSTGLTVHGLVSHLTHVERWWIRDVFAGEPELSYAWTDEDVDGDLHPGPDVTLASLLADYQAEWVASDAAIAGRALDEIAAHRDFSLRWVLLHLIEETARHAGHLDLLREQADGAVGMQPRREQVDEHQ